MFEFSLMGIDDYDWFCWFYLLDVFSYEIYMCDLGFLFLFYFSLGG